MTNQAPVQLEDKYARQTGRILLSGTQALVRLPLMQRARDAAAGLRTAGYITSRRGRDGGYELLKPADLIHVGSLLRLVDGPIAPLSCLSRTAYKKCADCRSEAACELRMAFDKPYADYLATLEGTTLAQVMAQTDGRSGR